MKYFLIRTGYLEQNIVAQGGGDPALTATEKFHLHDVSCFEMSDTLFNTLRPGWDCRIVEVPYEQAHWGSVFFSEIRTVGKITEPAKGIYTQPAKIPVDITPELIGYIVSFMKAVAFEIISQEFDRRFKEFMGVSLVEKESWEIQKHEAREWLADQVNSHTPFLDYLAQEQEIDKTVLANKILTKAEQYADSLSDMLVVYKKLIKEFKAPTTVWDLNILYEKYLGVFMPDTQAVQIPGWTVSETDPTRTTEVKIHEYNF
jgi:hypothetical protein